MNIARIGQNDPNDFFIEGNHARMSLRKVGEITKVHHSTVHKYIVGLTDTTLSEELTEKGLRGGELKEFVAYLVFDAKRITDEVRKHNIKLLADAGDFGFQVLIDRMAGLNDSPRVENNPNDITPELLTNTIDLVFKGVNIKPELIAGLKLNTIERNIPILNGRFTEARQLLIQSSADDRLLLTPTELGQRLGVSGQKVNKMLIEYGLQVKNPDKNGQKDPSYIPTDRGNEFSSFTLASGSGNNSTTYQQLRWYESTLMVLS